jgi:superfamily II DNA or RNA helicase
VEFIQTGFEYELYPGQMLNVAQMVATMREDTGRDWIVKEVLDKYEPGDTFIALGDSLEYLRQLQDYVIHQGHAAAFVCGQTKKTEREKIMDDMRAGKYQYLFATYQLAKLGLDIPRLNKLVLVTPKRDKTSIIAQNISGKDITLAAYNGYLDTSKTVQSGTLSE